MPLNLRGVTGLLMLQTNAPDGDRRLGSKALPLCTAPIQAQTSPTPSSAGPGKPPTSGGGVGPTGPRKGSFCRLC